MPLVRKRPHSASASISSRTTVSFTADIRPTAYALANQQPGCTATWLHSLALRQPGFSLVAVVAPSRTTAACLKAGCEHLHYSTVTVFARLRLQRHDGTSRTTDAASATRLQPGCSRCAVAASRTTAACLKAGCEHLHYSTVTVFARLRLQRHD